MNVIEILHSRLDWIGDMSSLVEEVSAIEAQLGYPIDGNGPNARSMRHYQGIGCVSKADARRGSKSVYTYRHLIEAVSVKVLMGDAWKLSKIGEILAGLEVEEIERLISSRREGKLSLGAAQPALSSGGGTPNDAATEALDLIAGFRRTAGLPSAHLPRSSASPSVMMKRLTEYCPAPWLRITVDEQALARAEPGNVVRALAEAAAILSSLKS